MSLLERPAHQINGNELDVTCSCGWYNHNPRRDMDKSATAHVIREVAQDPHRADDLEAEYREWMDL